MGAEVLAGPQAYEGVMVYPLTVGMLIENAGVFSRAKEICKAENINMESFSSDPAGTLEKLLPVFPDLLRMVTRLDAASVNDLGLDVAVGVLAVSLRQNIGYLRKLLGPILQVAVGEITREQTT